MSSTTIVEETVRLTAEPMPYLGEMKLVVGQQVLDIISDPEFIRQWDELYEACPWATVFQSSRFVTTWYANYATIHTPILVVSRHEGRLTGLLAMADHIPELGIAGAGGYDAYYHIWLTVPALSDGFIGAAIQLIRGCFPGKDICLKYIPPNVPVDWITGNIALKSHCVTRQFSRPILDVSQVEERHVLSRKQFREKNNRLKRFGTVSFEVISDPVEFIEGLNSLLHHYDLRKAATYGIMPFREDPAKIPFLMDLVRQGLLIAGVLKVKDQVCAMITVTTPSNSWVHGAGITAHNLKFSRATPGYVITKLLSVWLKKYGAILYDITPGDHAYKNLHASGHDTLLELRVTNPLNALGLASIYYTKEAVKKHLYNHHIQPSKVKEQLLRYVQEMKRPATGLSASYPASKSGKATVWHLNSAGAHDNGQVHFSKDSIAELLMYDARAGKINAKVFMRNAMALYESGQVLYTYTQKHELKCVVWASLQNDHGRAALGVEAQQQVPENCVLLHGLHTFNTQPEEMAHLIDALALQLKAEYPSTGLYLLLDRSPHPLPKQLQLVKTE